MAEVRVHLQDEVIVGDRAVRTSGHRPHQLVDLVVVESNVQRGEAKAELLGADDTITVSVEHGKGLLQVEVVDVESRGHLVQHLVQS